MIVALSSFAAAGSMDAPGTHAAWPVPCPSLEEPPPLSLAAARQAQRAAARRHELRLREAATPGSLLRELNTTLDSERIAAGEVCLADLADRGQLLFEHEYSFSDGLGSGDAAKGSRPPFRRVHRGLFGGPETIGCPSCHWVGGPNGAGAETDNAMLSGDGDRIGSGDARNPQALMGLGVVQALAAEMSRELQRQRAELVRSIERTGEAGEVELVAKGVGFGVLRISAKGETDASGIEGVDADLIIKPFGWKGNFATFAEFAAEAFQVHIGIQTDALLATGSPAAFGDGPDPTDPDADGVRNELRDGPFKALLVHLALREQPIVEPLLQYRQIGPAAPELLAPTTTSFAEDFRIGREQFHSLGCADCHRPMMVLDSPVLDLEGMPPIDLSRAMREPRLRYDESVGGYPVWLFSDLKRHDMGASNAAQHVHRGVGVREYMTPRLWGVADSAPYLHDGRAPSFDYAIAGHDGEGTAARDAFAALDWHAKGPLRVYLMSLRRASRVIVP